MQTLEHATKLLLAEKGHHCRSTQHICVWLFLLFLFLGLNYINTKICLYGQDYSTCYFDFPMIVGTVIVWAVLDFIFCSGTDMHPSNCHLHSWQFVLLQSPFSTLKSIHTANIDPPSECSTEQQSSNLSNQKLFFPLTRMWINQKPAVSEFRENITRVIF